MFDQTLRRTAMMLLTGALLLQLGTCAGVLAPAVLAIGEQIALQQLVTRLPLF